MDIPLHLKVEFAGWAALLVLTGIACFLYGSVRSEYRETEVERLICAPGKPARPNPKEIPMHYRNGRPAKNGDKVVLSSPYGGTVVGILYDATAGNDFCNGKIAMTKPNDPCPNLKECLHLDDVLAALGNLDEVPAN